MYNFINTGPVIGTAHALENPLSNSGVSSLSQTEGSLLPSGWPARLDDELAWHGMNFQDEPDKYIYRLTATDLEEISSAIAYFKSLKLDGEHVSRETFPIPLLSAKLDQLSHDVHSGRGFCLVRGIKAKEWSVEDLTLIYLGIQTYIANERGRQDSRGNMLVHIVANAKSKFNSEHHRHSKKSITFHNEETGDVIGWLTRSTALSGGSCIIASAYTVYNVLAARRPDLLRLLARSDWPFALPSFQCRPVVFYQNDRLIMNFGRAGLLGNAIHPRPRNLPRVTVQQREALDAIEMIARATQLEIRTQEGDMHFINNLAILHRREAFTDDSRAAGLPGACKRHLVRMRLRSSTLNWALPQDLEAEWRAAFDPEARQMWHLEPMPEAYFPLRKYPN